MPQSSKRLPAETTLGRVTLEIADLKRSLGFYTKVLGFEVVHRDDASTRLGSTDGRILLELRERPGAAPMPPRGRLGLYHFAILLPDRAALGRFVTHLGALGLRTGSADHIVSEALYLHDPDGLGIEVYADRARESWAQRGGEIVMDSLALDLAELAQAGGGAPWTGLPPGTRVGHVHLHVGDIAAAREFYEDALGFEPMVWSYPGAAFLAAGGYHHHLGLNTWAGPRAENPSEGHARLLEWQIVLPDADSVRAATERLERAGHRINLDDARVRVTDPWGTTVALSEPDR